jgi:hypothetical protein
MNINSGAVFCKTIDPGVRLGRFFRDQHLRNALFAYQRLRFMRLWFAMISNGPSGDQRVKASPRFF